MEKPRVLCLFNEGRYTVFAPLLRRLQDEGIIEDWQGISITRIDALIRSSRPEDSARVVHYRDFPQTVRTYAEASDFVEKAALEIPGIHFGKIYAGEKYPQRYFPGGLVDIANALASIKSHKEKHGLNAVFSDYPAGTLDMMAYYLFKGTGGHPFYFTQGRVGERLLYIDDISKPKPEIQERYDRYSQGVEPGEVKEAEEYLAKFRRNKVKPAYFEMQIQPRNFFNYFRKLLYYPGSFKPAEIVQAKIKRIKARRSWSKVPFQKIDARDRIVFFPIQYMPEASVNIRSPDFRNQTATASQLAMNLPPGYTLYLKDHPLLKWDRDDAYYQGLLEMPNVKLVEYSTDTHDILKASRLTVTGSSTAGLESLLYGIPVLLLGGADTAYQNFKGVLKIGRHPMDEAIRLAMAQKIREEDKIPMVLSMLKAGVPGIFDDPRWNSKVISAENMENLYRFIKSGFERMPARV